MCPVCLDENLSNSNNEVLVCENCDFSSSTFDKPFVIVFPFLVNYVFRNPNQFEQSIEAVHTDRSSEIDTDDDVAIVDQFRVGDRVRIDNNSDNHGKHGKIIDLDKQKLLRVRLSNGAKVRVDINSLRPIPNVDTSLYHREHDVLTNIWGDELPSNLRDIKDESLLWEMRGKLSDAVEECYHDDDMDALGILFPLEYKISEILSERLVGD